MECHLLEGGLAICGMHAILSYAGWASDRSRNAILPLPAAGSTSGCEIKLYRPKDLILTHGKGMGGKDVSDPAKITTG